MPHARQPRGIRSREGLALRLRRRDQDTCPDPAGAGRRRGAQAAGALTGRMLTERGTKGPPRADGQDQPVAKAKVSARHSWGHVVSGLHPAVWSRSKRQPGRATPQLQGRAAGRAGPASQRRWEQCPPRGRTDQHLPDAKRTRAGPGENARGTHFAPDTRRKCPRLALSLPLLFSLEHPFPSLSSAAQRTKASHW